MKITGHYMTMHIQCGKFTIAWQSITIEGVLCEAIMMSVHIGKNDAYICFN